MKKAIFCLAIVLLVFVTTGVSMAAEGAYDVKVKHLQMIKAKYIEDGKVYQLSHLEAYGVNYQPTYQVVATTDEEDQILARKVLIYQEISTINGNKVEVTTYAYEPCKKRHIVIAHNLI